MPTDPRRRRLVAALVALLVAVGAVIAYALTRPEGRGTGDASGASPDSAVTTGDAGGASTAPSAGADGADGAPALDSLRGPLTSERFYFVMTDRFANGDPSNDRGGLTGKRTVTGYDPTDMGFFHGGDLAGVTGQLDYLQGLGITAIWLTPVMTNQAVQGPPGQESAAYHGYWVTDFTSVDPHLGTDADLQRLVEQAHGRGMKVFLDIITNHTADVIDYRGGASDYVPIDEAPYRDTAGQPFDDAAVAGSPDFPAVDIDSFPYTPVLEPAERHLKAPEWLNDPTMYHNRGNSTFEGESSTYGDFFGLDDLWTERPEVVQGMIAVYSAWVDAGVDGFRIDTVKHVDTEFWTEFGPALLQHAADAGNDDFFLFGEVYDANPIAMSTYTTTGRLPATLDFGFQAAATGYLKGGPASGMAGFYDGDDWYTDADSNAYALPTFLGNHDMGRFPQFLGGVALLHHDLPDRVALGHTLMFLTRGQPVVYYGDEQGFIGRRGDKDARQDMFATQVPQFADQELVSGDPGSRDRYDTSAPLYQHIAALSALRESHPALADGAQITRYAANGPGIVAFSRLLPSEGVEYVVAVNNDVAAATAPVQTYAAAAGFEPIWGGSGSLTSDDTGVLTLTVPAMSAVVYRAVEPLPAAAEPLAVTVEAGPMTGRAAISAQVSAQGLPAERAPFAQVTFSARPAGGGDWQVLGTDDAPPYRVYPDVTTLPTGDLEIRAVATPLTGASVSAATTATVAPPAEPPAEGQPASVSVPGTLDVALGCSADWAPECPAAALAYDAASGTWRATWELPKGRYELKVAIDGSWDENYGAGGAADGDNIVWQHPGGPATFDYDHATHELTITAP